MFTIFLSTLKVFINYIFQTYIILKESFRSKFSFNSIKPIHVNDLDVKKRRVKSPFSLVHGSVLCAEIL